MNFALIGSGYWGRNFLRILNSIDEVNLLCIVDKNNQVTKEGLTIFKDVDGFLESKINVDAAIVSTPTSTHYNITKKLIEKGIHVLVEKPLATSFSESKELGELANTKEVTLLTDHTFLYNEAINYAINYIQNGEIGNLLHISFERNNLGPIRTDTSCLWDLTTHDVSILNSITDLDPVNISSYGFKSKNDGDFDMVNISLGYESNLFVTLFSSWLHPEKTRKIKIVGDEKMIIFDDLDLNQPLKIFDKKFKQIYEKEKYFEPNQSFFSFSIGNITSPYIESSEPLKEVVLDFISRINTGIPKYEKNNMNLTMRTIEVLEKINNDLEKNTN